MDEESLFVEALQKPTMAERQKFLDKACGDDLALRRRIEQLLKAHDRTLGILDRPEPPGWTLFAGGTPDDSPDAPSAGAVLAGRYKLLQEVGVGGMGTVWKAEQMEPVRRIVALKLIKPGMDSRNVLARFEAERQALALMEHPNIARVLDGGTTDAGRPFFVMEFVEGVPLTRYCDDEKLSVAERLELFVAVCQAVQHAHTKGVIHRDLKPNNILVSRYEGHAVPKVIDFGLAKATGERLIEETLQTAHGAVLGTPLYMSPEQAEVNNIDVDARADVYALGVILYELLTGSTPLERGRFNEAALHEMLRLIREEDPPRPSARLSSSDSLPNLAAERATEPGRLARLVKGELDWIVMKCLEKDRTRRYETASGLTRDIRRYLADESVEACPPSAGYLLGKFVRRNQGPIAVATIIVVLLVGGIAGTTWGLIRVDSARKAEAERAEGEARANAAAQRRLRQVEKASEVLESVFEDLDPNAEVKEGRPLRAILGDRLDRAAADLEGDAVGDPLVVANLQYRLGRTYRALGFPAKAKDLLTKAVATRRERLGPEHKDTLAAQSQRASTIFELAEPAEAFALYEQVRDTQARTLGLDHADTLSTDRNLAMAYYKSGEADKARAILERSRGILVAKFGPDDAQVLDILTILAGVYSALGKGKEAIAMAEQVRDARLKKHGPDHLLYINSINALALRYRAAGQMRKALALFEQARDEIVPRLSADHPYTLMILDSLSGTYRAFGRLDEAIQLGERVREARVQSLGIYNPYTVLTMWSLGAAYKARGDNDKALALLLQAGAGIEKLDFNLADGGIIIGDLGDCLVKVGKTDEADAWRRKWIAAAKRKHGADSVTYAGVLLDEGESFLRSERFKDAEPLLAECVAIYDRKPPSDMTFYAQSTLGAALTGLGRYADAEPLIVKGYEGLKAREGEIPPLFTRHRLAMASERAVRLYEAWGQPAKAAEWRTKVGPRAHAKPRP
ncbi:tetratricopeptide repeat protein [Singulisphaera sp. PoT]|uniref:tetratricopeptide repeat protein n=1 Tax=Singulisphaera sp. PoT TaxID=3411797 RepID=UPI003BF532D6